MPIHLAILAICAAGWQEVPGGIPTHPVTIAVFLVRAAMAALLHWHGLGFERIGTDQPPEQNRAIAELLAGRQGWCPLPPPLPREAPYRAPGFRENVLVSVRFNGADALVAAIHQYGVATIRRGSRELQLVRPAVAPCA